MKVLGDQSVGRNTEARGLGGGRETVLAIRL